MYASMRDYLSHLLLVEKYGPMTLIELHVLKLSYDYAMFHLK